MAKDKLCGASTTTEDDRTLECVLPTGHFGPVHEDARGEQWGDALTPLPVPPAAV